MSARFAVWRCPECGGICASVGRGETEIHGAPSHLGDCSEPEPVKVEVLPVSVMLEAEASGQWSEALAEIRTRLIEPLQAREAALLGKAQSMEEALRWIRERAEDHGLTGIVKRIEETLEGSDG